MKTPELARSRWVTAVALFAIFFGLLTIVSGGAALFNADAQQLAGDYVGFVLWFNFLAGFAYVVAGIGMWTLQRWSLWLAIAIATATLCVFGAFGYQVWLGHSYESRTLGAMVVRSVFWILASIVVSRNAGGLTRNQA